jgi:hypothetical protein
MEKKKENPSSLRVTNSKPIPHIPLPFKEVIADVLKVKPPKKHATKRPSKRKGV